MKKILRIIFKGDNYVRACVRMKVLLLLRYSNKNKNKSREKKKNDGGGGVIKTTQLLIDT